MTTTVQTRPKVEVERFDIAEAPDSGRPRVVEFTIPKKGRLSIHAERDTGALWIFVSGPAGGDRGRLVFGLKDGPARVAAFLNGAEVRGNVLWSNDYTLAITQPARIERGEDGHKFVPEETDDRIVSVRKGSSMQPWSARFDAAALAELRAVLREWSATALAATMPAPKIGDFFVRGATPGGTPEQVRAWVQAGPEGNLVTITGGPGTAAGEVPDDQVRYVRVARDGGYHVSQMVPLVDFYGEGWRRLG